MTNEQREAIEFLEFYKQHCLKKEIENMDNYETIHDGDFVSKNLDTVLALIKEQQDKIAKYEKIYKEYDCYRWVKELDKKDKQIDLMAFNLADYVMYYEYDKCRNPEMIKNKAEELKQYFERKSEDEK